MHATMPRPAPVPPVAVLRSAFGLVAALVVGGLMLLLVLAIAGAGAAWWAVVAGALACASGVVVGATRYTVLAVGLGLAAAVALAIAIGASEEHERRAAFPPREELAVAADGAGGRSRGDAVAEGGRRTGAKPEVGTSAAAEDLVRSYYAALDAGDFETAWARLAPQVRSSFGGLEAWRAGYGTTLGHEIEDLRVRPNGVVRHVLVAADRTPCGGQTERRFAVTWRLGPSGTVVELSAAKLSGADPAAAC